MAELKLVGIAMFGRLGSHRPERIGALTGGETYGLWVGFNR
jgi:hypothetical protein